MMIVVMTSAVPAFGASGTHITFSGQMAGTKGKMAYYSVGYCGGPLYSYNSATGVSRKIASGHWMWINVKGKYLYLTRDKIGSEDSSNMYIYRMKKNGKSRKRLAAGNKHVR